MLTLQLLIDGLATGSLAAATAMGFSLILGVHRFWHIAHGAVFVWSTYVVYLLLASAPFWVGVILAPVIGAAVGLAIDAVVYSGLRTRRASGLVLLVASLGVYIAATNGAGAIFGFDPRVHDGNALSTLLVSGSITISWEQIAMVGVGGVSIVVSLWLLNTRRIGLETRAVLADTEMAAVVGVRLRRVRMATMGFGSALVGWPALFTVISTGADPTTGLNIVLIAAIAAIIGGMGSMLGAYLGALLIGVVSTIPLTWISAEWQDTVTFGVLIVFMLVRPTGFFGNTIWKARV